VYVLKPKLIHISIAMEILTSRETLWTSPVWAENIPGTTGGWMY